MSAAHDWKRRTASKGAHHHHGVDLQAMVRSIITAPAIKPKPAAFYTCPYCRGSTTDPCHPERACPDCEGRGSVNTDGEPV